MSNRRISIISTGGTILQKEVAGRMEVSVPIQDLTRMLSSEVEFDLHELTPVSGAEITFDSLARIRDAVRRSREVGVAGVVITTGTDSLEEMAFALDLLLEPGAPVVLTAAMKPTGALGYDGIANLQHAVLTALSEDERARRGVLVVMSGVIHLGRYVRKQDASRLDAFQSHPGPMGDIRRGRPNFYFQPPMDYARFLEPDLNRLSGLRVPLWTMTIQPFFPVEGLDSADALVVAGMGTGSLSQEVINFLSPRWTQRLPVVLATRCATGTNYDDHIYAGSLEKYEARGFRLRGYEGLNALQSRLQLMLELASARE